jgi:hypothetical protein
VDQTEPKAEPQQSDQPSDWSWAYWFTVPLYPYRQRRTLRTEVVPNTVWTFDQVQGILYVVVPIRMTVIKLASGGLFVYAPIAPTPECIRLVKELVAEHGEVKYILLPTVSGLEHKVFVGPFARQFPTAQVYVAPNQWSFPLNLPLSWLGFPPQRTHILPANCADAPFASEFDYALLDIDLGARRFGEVAVWHRRSRTLLVTDAVLSVPEVPPAIVCLDPYPLLFHARDSELDAIEDTPANRRKGWQRIALFAFYFRPHALEVIDMGPSIRATFRAVDRSRKAYFGWFPFRWKPNWQQSFHALRGNGRLFVAPILQTLILNRGPKATIAWADQIARWHFDRIIPCHLDAPIAAGPSEFRQAFTFLEKQPDLAHPASAGRNQPLPEADFALLKEIEVALNKRGITPPAQEKV